MRRKSVGIGFIAFAALCVAALPPAFAQLPATGKNTGLTVKGSDTMVNLAAAWAEAFMKQNPGASVSVSGGGSGVGISALLGGTTDVCDASRDVSPEEKKKAAEANISPVETNVALDGVAIIVNPDNPINEVSMDQLREIYTGEVTNWQALNGQDQKIIVLSRENSSGTYVLFQEHVLKKQDYTPSARHMPTTGAIVESVATDKGAIGYVGLGYAAHARDRVKVLPVKAGDQSPAVEATEETVRSGKYPIARPLHCYTNGKPKGLADQYLKFCLGPEGQSIVREQGFVPLR